MKVDQLAALATDCYTVKQTLHTVKLGLHQLKTFVFLIARISRDPCNQFFEIGMIRVMQDIKPSTSSISLLGILEFIFSYGT